MKELTQEEMSSISGGVNPLDFIPDPTDGPKVIVNAIQGVPPGPASTTGTASGPTPGGVGGRYPESALGAERSLNNVPGGQFGKAIGSWAIGGSTSSTKTPVITIEELSDQ